MAAKARHIVGPPDRVLAADTQTEGVIFSVTGVREVQFPQQGRIEGSGRSKPVDTEGVIAAVLGSPFFMIDNSGRDGSHIKIGHSVGPDYHGASLFVEGFHGLTQGMLATVYIITIQLDGEPAASRMVYSYIPATPSAKVVAFRLDMGNTKVRGGDRLDPLGGAIRGAIIDNDQVEREGRLLSQYGTDDVLDRPYTVTYRDDNGDFRLKYLLIKTDWLEMRGQVTTYHL